MPGNNRPSSRSQNSSRSQASGGRGGRGRGRHGEQAQESAASLLKDSRFKAVFIAFGVIVLAVLIRLVYLQVIVAGDYSEAAIATRTSNITTTPRRGTIYDCNGNVLAISTDAKTIYCNPVQVTDASGTAAKLVEVLGGERDYYYQQLTTQNTTFAYISRQEDVAKAEALAALDLEGIYFLDDTRREYPYGETGGQIIGMVAEIEDEDGGQSYHGVCGLEAYYDDVLCGTPGTYTAEVAYVEQTVEDETAEDGQSKVVRRIAIPGRLKEETKAVDGQDIMISVDIELQGYVETRIAEDAKKYSSETSNCIIVDSSTGEIRAAASTPLFNPSKPAESAVGSDYVKGITQATEPGSIYKVVGALAILEAGTMTPDTEIYCPAAIEADGYWVSDAHERGDTTYTLREIMDNSSNVGISLSVQNNLGFDKFYDAISRYKLDEYTGVDYPGEGVGYVAPFERWGLINGYNATFGQGLTVTPLQMVRFYGSLLNDGYETVPHFLTKNLTANESPEYERAQVVNNTAAIPDMVSMLRTVVEDGTGQLADIDGYEIVGKTSTAEIPAEDGSGYLSGYYNMAFLGFIADSSSSLVCYVGAMHVAYEVVMTPTFKDIMSYVIDRYRIVP